MLFFQTQTVSQVLQKMREQIEPLNEKITIFIEESLGMIVADPLISAEYSPNFVRSTVDGYAVISSDTFGASDTMPAYIKIKGSVQMGEETKMLLSMGETVYVPTGGMVPAGADAVCMIEYTENLNGLLNIYKQVAPMENCIQIGEDIVKGEIILQKGHRIRSQDIALLASLGMKQVTEKKPPIVGYLSTGDEIVSYETSHLPIGKIRDSNVASIRAACKQMNASFVYGGIVKDSEQDLLPACQSLLDEVDLLVISGGSSVGERDYSYAVFNQLGKPGVYVHGISIKPGKPTLIGQIGKKPILGLPGHPVSASVIFEIFGKEMLRCLLGTYENPLFTRRKAKILRNIPSQSGRTDYFRVQLVNENAEWIAYPVYGKSGVLNTLVKSDGLAVIPEEAEGVKAGEWVEVILLS